MRSRPIVLPILLAALFAAAPRARAQDTTTRGVRLGLTYQGAMVPGVVVGMVRGTFGDTIHAMLQRDLDAGDRVSVIGMPATPAAAAIQQVGYAINYVVWKTLGAAAALQLSVGPAGLHVALHDVAKGSVVQVRDFPLPGTPGSADWRLAVHAASDEAERWITGTRGISATRVLFVREGRIEEIDSDGWGAHAVTTPGLALSPAWHPSGRIFAYSLNHSRGWRIMVQDLAGGAPHALGATPEGLNITPAFSPDGRNIAYAHGDEDGTDLYLAPLTAGTAAGQAQRITAGGGTDNVSPTFSPDGHRVAFTSGKLGHPEVYLADADGTNVEMLTPLAFGDAAYRSNPDWSPDGTRVAYQEQIGGIFQLMMIALRDRTVRQLTSDGRNEDPSWAPDGRHLVFSTTRTGTRELYVLDVESGRARQLTHLGGARLPAWSPMLAGTP